MRLIVYAVFLLISNHVQAVWISNDRLPLSNTLLCLCDDKNNIHLIFACLHRLFSSICSCFFFLHNSRQFFTAHINRTEPKIVGCLQNKDESSRLLVWVLSIGSKKSVKLADFSLNYARYFSVFLLHFWCTRSHYVFLTHVAHIYRHRVFISSFFSRSYE